jgi:transcription antitermination protein NusB
MSENTPETTATPAGKSAEKPAKPKSARRWSRELALQGLYQWRVGGNDEAAIEAYLPEMDDYRKADREFMTGLLRGVMAQRDRLSEQVSQHIDRSFDELSPIEACILMLGAYELAQHPETPYRVIINEAIELTKAFGGTDGHKYVNGVLDKVAAGVRPAEVAARKQGR